MITSNSYFGYLEESESDISDDSYYFVMVLKILNA